MASSELFYDMSDGLVKYGQLQTVYDIKTSMVNFWTRLGYACIRTEGSDSGMQYVYQAMRFLGLSGTSSYSDAMTQMYVSNYYQVDTLPHYCNLVRLQFDEPIEYFSNIGAINTYLLQALTLWQNGESGYANSFNIMHRYITGQTGSLVDVSISLSSITPQNITDYYAEMIIIINQVVADCEQVLTGYPTDSNDYYIDDLSESGGFIYNSPQQTAIIRNRPSVLEVINLHTNICYLYGWVYDVCSNYGYSPDYTNALLIINNHINTMGLMIESQQQTSVNSIPYMYQLILRLLNLVNNQ